MQCPGRITRPLDFALEDHPLLVEPAGHPVEPGQETQSLLAPRHLPRGGHVRDTFRPACNGRFPVQAGRGKGPPAGPRGPGPERGPRPPGPPRRGAQSTRRCPARTARRPDPASRTWPLARAAFQPLQTVAAPARSGLPAARSAAASPRPPGQRTIPRGRLRTMTTNASRRRIVLSKPRRNRKSA